MATYRELHGRSIQAVTTDPTGEVAEGQIWYNTTTDTFKSVLVTEAWASASSLNNNSQGRAGFGSQAAAVAGPGQGPSGSIQVTEEYNGSGWSNGNNSTRSAAENQYTSGAGTPTAGAMASGGYPGTMTAETEEYDGTSWTAGNNIGTAVRNYVFDGASYTSALVFGGNSQPHPGTATNITTTQIYDGTNWTTGGAMNTGRRNHAGSSQGNESASLATAGNVPGLSSNTEEYNGTSWTEVTNQPTAIAYQGYAGTQTNAIVWNGYTPSVVTTTLGYDGSSWSSKPSVSGQRLNYHNNSGTAPAALIFGGEGPSGTLSTVEQFNRSANIITAAAWASGTALPSARFNGASAGTATAGIIAGGELAPGTRTGETVYFDGSAWTAQPATLSPAPNADGVKMAGTQTAGILNSFRGGGSPGPAYTDARSWNGSAWSTIPSTSSNHSFSNLFRNGTPSAATTIGGDNEVGGIQSAVEEYNGSSWGSETALPAGRGNMAAFGTPSAGVIAGGALGPGTPNRTATALEYNGSSWTTTGSITEAATVVAGGGTQTTGIIFGGYNPSPAATGRTNTYDGTVFSTAPTMATARGGTYSIGDSSGAYAAGGNPPVSTTVEEFSPQTEAVNVKTLTQS